MAIEITFYPSDDSKFTEQGSRHLASVEPGEVKAFYDYSEPDDPAVLTASCFEDNSGGRVLESDEPFGLDASKDLYVPDYDELSQIERRGMFMCEITLSGNRDGYLMFVHKPEGQQLS